MVDAPAKNAHGIEQRAHGWMVEAARRGRGRVERDRQDAMSRNDGRIKDKERSELGCQDDVPLGRRNKAHADGGHHEVLFAPRRLLFRRAVVAARAR